MGFQIPNQDSCKFHISNVLNAANIFSRAPAKPLGSFAVFDISTFLIFFASFSQIQVYTFFSHLI